MCIFESSAAFSGHNMYAAAIVFFVSECVVSDLVVERLELMILSNNVPIALFL